MNQGIYDLMVKELRESRERFDAIVQAEYRFASELLHHGNGTLREESEQVSREFRDKL